MIDVATALALTEPAHDELMAWLSTFGPTNHERCRDLPPDRRRLADHVTEVEVLDRDRGTVRIRHYLLNEDGHRFLFGNEAATADSLYFARFPEWPRSVDQWAPGPNPPAWSATAPAAR